MKRACEEILEALWKAEECDDCSLESVKSLCAVDVMDEDLDVLLRQRMITREADRLVLSHQGRLAARNVLRRHRLAECLFATILDLDAEMRETMACEIEHVLLPEVEQAICTLLGHPTICPDGKPIPPGQCCNSLRTVASTLLVNLTHLAPGERGRISYLKPKNPERLHRLMSFGLTPGTVVRLEQTSPAFCIRYEGTEIALDRQVAEDVFLSRMD